MSPFWVALNFTPSVTAWGSGLDGTAGTAAPLHRLDEADDWRAALTAPPGAAERCAAFALSGTERCAAFMLSGTGRCAAFALSGVAVSTPAARTAARAAASQERPIFRGSARG
ncbi:hypothetical protein GCM10010517_69780 [Streptosporangium fragile]|uniref:Uncharacterized protein n=1 Tax=Streptosporangium fragile TaxID=46186 RepID=A0ABP6IQ82_9ACTN